LHNEAFRIGGPAQRVLLEAWAKLPESVKDAVLEMVEG
jgi:hypothetical protein